MMNQASSPQNIIHQTAAGTDVTDSVHAVTKLKAFFADAEAIPKLELGSVPQELLAQLKKERKALRQFAHTVPVVNGDHWKARCYAYDAYLKINELVRVYTR